MTKTSLRVRVWMLVQVRRLQQTKPATMEMVRARVPVQARARALPPVLPPTVLTLQWVQGQQHQQQQTRLRGATTQS